MTLPYAFRICAALPGGPTIELFRSKSHDWPKTYEAVTRGMSSQWHTWIERPMADRMSLTPRIKFPAENTIEARTEYLNRRWGHD